MLTKPRPKLLYMACCLFGCQLLAQSDRDFSPRSPIVERVDLPSLLVDPEIQFNPPVATQSGPLVPTATTGHSVEMAWWQTEVVRPLGLGAITIPVEVHSLVYDALRHSAQVRAINEYAAIADTGITEAKAGFDPSVFLETRFQRLSLPTGSQLEAGFNVTRLRQSDWLYKGGLRQRNQWGGNWELSQQVGGRDSNSQFFFPTQQANSRLALNFTQPLLNGAGCAYNRSLIVLAMIDFRIAADRTSQELQEHLLRVTETHWELYRVRCALLQKRKNLAAARDLVEHLTRRQILDVNQSQVQQARAVLATRQAAVIQLETNVRNAEARVRALVNSPLLLDQQGAELVTVENPSPQTFKINLEDALVTTLKERPEFDRVLAEIEAARVKLQVARNELLPVLDAVLDSYVSGLRGNYDIVDAWSDQLQRGEPSYTAGLVYEVPLYRRAARARIERRHLELRQLSSQLQALTENLRTEVEIAARDMETAQRLQLAKSEAVQAAAMNLQALQRRWEILPGDDRSASFLLQDLLDAQDRLNDEEEGLVQAQVETVLSFARLNRATGVMLKLYNNS